MRFQWPRRVSIVVVTNGGENIDVEFRFIPGWVEVWYRDRRIAVVDHGYLSLWLTKESSPLRAGDLELTVNANGENRGQVSFCLSGIDAGTLSPFERERLLTAINA